MGVLFRPYHCLVGTEENVADANDINISMSNLNGRPRSYDGRAEGLGEDFFDLLYKSQSARLDDQRVEFPNRLSVNTNQRPRQPVKAARQKSDETNQEGFMDLVARLQADRMDEQRCSFPLLPGLASEVKERLLEQQQQKQQQQQQQQQQKKSHEIPDDAFLDMLMRCQSSRINDQRVEFPPIPRGPTVPDEDFFNLIVRLQSKRIDTQRVSFDTRKHSL